MEGIEEVIEGANSTPTISTQQDFSGVEEVQKDMQKPNETFDEIGMIDAEGETTEKKFTTVIAFEKPYKARSETFEELAVGGCQGKKEEDNMKPKLESNYPSWEDDNITLKIEYNENLMKYHTDTLKLLECDLEASRDILENTLLNEALELSTGSVDEEYLSFLRMNKNRMTQQITEFEQMRDSLISKLSSVEEYLRQLYEVRNALKENKCKDLKR